MPRPAWDLIIVGGGPTGISALFEAAHHGLRAVALETGDTPLAAMASHLEGLRYASPARHFEIGGLPLDTLRPEVCTREDVLRYYARVIEHARLEIRTGHRCVAFDMAGDRVTVWAERPDRSRIALRSRFVIVTGWYGPRTLNPGSIVAGSRVRVLYTLPRASALAGQRVVVFGGGMSGAEYAAALMQEGHRVALLSRGKKKAKIHDVPAFVALRRATGSKMYEDVQDVRVEADAISFRKGQRRRQIPCDAVVVATGRQLDESLVEALTAAGVFDAATAKALRTPAPIAAIRRVFPELSRAELRRHHRQPLVDLWPQAFQGRIRVAGGITHYGSSAAGVLLSILGAAHSVRSIVGIEPRLGRPLPRALYDLAIALDAAAPPASPLIAHIRPLAVSVIGQQTVSENPIGLDQRLARVGAPPARDAATQELLDVADGTGSIADIARANRCSTDDLLAAYRALFRDGIATWLPRPRSAWR